MPKKSTQSNLKANDAAFAGHAKDKTDFGFIEMPPGITGGVARLTKCTFSKYKKGENIGEEFFIAIATGVEPDRAPNGSRARGATIQLMEPLCETTNGKGEVKSYEEHAASVMNEMRKMGIDTSGVSSLDDVKVLAQALEDAGPYIRFATSQSEPTDQYPNPRIWHNWNGIVADYEQVETQDVEEEVGELPEHGEAAPEDEVPFDPSDINDLALAADNGDEDAQEKIAELAASAGIDDDVVAGTKDWAEVADLITATEEGDDDVGGPELEDPEKEQVYNFKPPRAKKEIEVIVTAVYKKIRTCNLKAIETGKLYKGVSWDKLVVG